MKTEQVIKPWEELTHEQRMEICRRAQHNRFIARPKAKQAKKQVERKRADKSVTKTKKLVDNLSPEEKAKLIAQLSGD